MDNKLSELKDALEFLETTEFDGEWDSALVGGENGKNYHAVINANDVVVRAADDSRHTSWLCDYLEAVSPVKIHALLAELEAKDKRIAELESGNELLTNQRDLWYGKVRDLEAKLATPVRLPALFHPESDAVNGMIFANGRNDAIAECSVAIRQAGFLSEASPMTVEGDE
ncbi:hypothetical protein [Serratia sp. 201]|uniref:hypothetical protein n=1 Tax=Serratia sp. 201 TaxID=3096764 RepID=UPI00300B03FE